ncbi:unnamed protein product, partial [Effrenium voratum]
AKWAALLPRLQALDHLLNSVTWRERFVSVCMGDQHPDRDLILQWSGDKLGGLRWEVIANFCRDVLPVQGLLRNSWDLKRYLKGTDESEKRKAPTQETRPSSTAMPFEG